MHEVDVGVRATRPGRCACDPDGVRSTEVFGLLFVEEGPLPDKCPNPLHVVPLFGWFEVGTFDHVEVGTDGCPSTVSFTAYTDEGAWPQELEHRHMAFPAVLDVWYSPGCLPLGGVGGDV